MIACTVKSSIRITSMDLLETSNQAFLIVGTLTLHVGFNSIVRSFGVRFETQV